MHKQLKIALIVEAIVLVIAAGFSIFYFVMGLYHSSRVLDVLLVILWVIVAFVLLLWFRSRSFVREAMVRRFYLSHDWVYNHEIGYAPLSQIIPDGDAYEFVTFAADALAKMSYGFEVADAPTDFVPEYLITSARFECHLIGDDADPADKGVVIDRWQGALKRVKDKGNGTHEFEELGKYSGAIELAHLLEEAGAVDTMRPKSDSGSEQLGFDLPINDAIDQNELVLELEEITGGLAHPEERGLADANQVMQQAGGGQGGELP